MKIVLRDRDPLFEGHKFETMKASAKKTFIDVDIYHRIIIELLQLLKNLLCDLDLFFNVAKMHETIFVDFYIFNRRTTL